MSLADAVARGRNRFGALVRASSPPPRLSRWAWTADAVLAAVVAVIAVDTVDSVYRHGGGAILLKPLPSPSALPIGPIFAQSPPIHRWELVVAALVPLPPLSVNEATFGATTRGAKAASWVGGYLRDQRREGAGLLC